MHCTHDPGTTNRMEGTPAANKLFVPEPTVKYNAGIQYNRLIHRRCASLDLEAVFKEIKISQNIEKELVANKPVQQLHLPVQTPSDEEANREVAAICRPSEYYRVRSHLCRRHHYLMYNTLDDIGEITQYKR